MRAEAWRRRIAAWIYPQTEENILRSEYVQRLRLRVSQIESSNKQLKSENKKLRKKMNAMEETKRLNEYVTKGYA